MKCFLSAATRILHIRNDFTLYLFVCLFIRNPFTSILRHKYSKIFRMTILNDSNLCIILFYNLIIVLNCAVVLS